MNEFINNLKFVWFFSKDNKKILLKYGIINFLYIIVRIIIPILSAKIIVYLTDNTFNELILICVILFVCNSLTDLFITIARKYEIKVAINSFIKIQKEVGKAVLKTENSVIDKNGTGLFIQRITNDPENLSEIFNDITGYVSGIVMYIGIFIAIFIVNKIVFCYIILSLYVINIFEKKRAKVWKENNKKRKEKNEQLSSMIGEFVRGIKDIKMLNAESNFLNHYDKNIKEYNEEIGKYQITNSRYFFKRNIVSEIFNFLFILLIIFLINIDEISVVNALVVYNYSKEIPYIVNFIGNIKDSVNNFNISANRIKELLNGEDFKKEKFGDIHLDNVKGHFEFKNVSFAYDKTKVLKDINFSVEPNKTVAFVGKSGTGKTTIFNLLCKMYDNYKGQITIDGIDLKKLDKDTIRGNITIISQNPYIFNMSIRKNIELVKENVTMDEIKKACKLACLDDFIESLDDKYDTMVGEGGVTLSGGQRQRLAIARALVQNTEIILFDEATSALDNETQKKISDAINNMKNKYTILIIAHRLSTIINADKILFIEDGCIKMEGTHKELLEKCDSYRKLYETEIVKEK